MHEFAIFWDWLSFAARWLHVITAIAWIGSSFYFIALDLGLVKREGMPEGADWREFFDTDKSEIISVDISPRFPRQVLEETDRYVIETSPWGVTMKQFKESASTPEFLDYRVHDPESWAEAKALMTLEDDRIPWEDLKVNYPRWKSEGRWTEAGFWFGFDVTHSWMAGTETVLVALMEEPEWVMDMFETYLNSCERLFGRIWDAGYRFDAIRWPDDMGYKGTTFFSPKLYRDIVKPFHARAARWAHERGAYAHLHSCGDVMNLVPDIVDAGLDSLEPLEVKAGMDAAKLKRDFPNLTLRGGINAVLWDKKDKIIAEIERVVPALKKGGGYIFSSDHSIPDAVSLENFRAIVAAAKRAGAY